MSVNATLRFSSGVDLEEDMAAGNMSYPSQYITTATILTLISVTGLGGNSLTIISVFMSTKLQTKTNVFVVNLAVGDVITCTGILVQLVALLSPREPLIPASFGDLIAILGSVSMSSTILTLAVIAIIRCVRATKSPIIFDGLFSTPKLTLMIFLIWAIPVSSNVLFYLGGGRNLYDSQIRMYKFALLENTGIDIPVAIFFVIDATLVIVCTLVMLICYLKIVLHVRAHTRRISVELGGVVSPSSRALESGNRDEPQPGHQAENRQQRSGRPARQPLRLEVDSSPTKP
nr:rhodopsin, GQ-coupled-like [Lytechinus pictus]